MPNTALTFSFHVLSILSLEAKDYMSENSENAVWARASRVI